MGLHFFAVSVIISANTAADERGEDDREVFRFGKVRKNYLYAYSFLRTVGKDYEEYIRNKAILSYNNRKSAESLAEEIAEELITQNKLLWLKEKVEQVVEKLTEREKKLVELKYWGRRLKKEEKEKIFSDGNGKIWSERKYFRAQDKLAKKLLSLFVFSGVSEELFEKEYSKMDIFKRAKRLVEREEVTPPIRKEVCEAVLKSMPQATGQADKAQ